MAVYGVDNLLGCQAKVSGEWVIARPENYKYRGLKEKICDAWAVYTGKANAVKFKE